MEQYCPPGTARFVPANKISPKFKRVHESFLLLKLISAKVKRLCDFSVFMEPEKASTRMKTKKTKMLISFKNTFCSKLTTKVCFEFENLNLKFEFEM